MEPLGSRVAASGLKAVDATADLSAAILGEKGHQGGSGSRAPHLDDIVPRWILVERARVQIDRRQNVEARLLRSHSGCHFEDGDALVVARVGLPPAFRCRAVCWRISNPYWPLLREFVEAITEIRIDNDAYDQFHS